MALNNSITTLKNIGPQVAKKLKNLGIETIQDLLLYFPARYLDFTKFTEIKNLAPGETVTVRGTIKTIATRFSFRTRTQLAEAIVSDSTGSIKVVWFNQGYVAKQLKHGDEVLLSGKVDNYKGLQLVNPVHEKITEEMIHTGRLVPVYRLPEGLYNRTFRGFMSQALEYVDGINDIIPQITQKGFDIVPINIAIKELHFPATQDMLKRAQVRMIFEEVFIQQLAVEQHKLLLKKLAAPSIKPNIGLIKDFLSTLPFALTDGQKKALWQILQDLEHKHPMNRLLQGNVGSGKTLVAIAAVLNATSAGYQTGILAPTEILARQHYEGVGKLLKNADVKTPLALLTRNFASIDGEKTTKKKLLDHLLQGDIKILIGTHAILQESIAFYNLAFVVVDEQHRFGVEQRAQLLTIGKSANGDKDAAWTPHLLSMSATPIPRTLALSMYSDLEVSTLTELPKGRQEIIAKIVPEHERHKAYAFILDQIKAGRQAFIITPLVEESEKLQAKSVKTEFDRLQKEVFSGYRVGLVHGKLKGAEKDGVMAAFNNHELDILVATSIIEIGIDVPNATVIVIESADRFGLAQLHQLRGRVGRGKHQSYCMLFTESQNETTIERLNFFASCSDGFKLAELDLQQRGFGSLFGKDQTGFNFRFSQYLTLKVLDTAKRAASKLTASHPSLEEFPELKQQVSPLIEAIHLE
jgi:ATP-dependent DNA helicase RecG